MANKLPDTFDIIILGGGFAGVYAAKTLAKELKRNGKTATIAIVSEENHMVFQPMLPEVAGATLSPRHVVNPIRSLCKEATVFRAKVTKLDIHTKTVSVSAGDFVGNRDLKFDQLAICLGAKIDLTRIPGMQEHSLLLQNAGDAMRIRAHFISRLEEANLATDSEVRKRLLSFVIVGGGYSGVEVSGQLIDFARDIRKQFKNLQPEEFTFTLVHSRDHLLPTLDKSLGKYTEAQLKKRGLKIRLEVRAKAVTANRVYLNDGSIIEANTIICTVGNAPHPIIQSLGTKDSIPLESGRLICQPDCSVADIPWLWTAGDCAAVPQKDGTFSPPTAQFALRQGEKMGRNIGRKMAGKPTQPFAFKAIGELASIGHQSAVAEIKGLRFSGFIAWWLWRSIYLMKLPGFERKLRVMFEWTLELFFTRDINLLNPNHTTDFAETYLEKGDILFHKDDPALSFYIVKSGSIELRDNGNPVTVVHANEHFGEKALLDKTNYLFQAVALEPTKLVSIRSSIFEKIVSADSSIAQSLKQSAHSYKTVEELESLLKRLPSEKLDRLVEDSMSRKLTVVTAETSIDGAIDAFKTASKNYLPIVDADGVPGGALHKERLYMELLNSDLDRNNSINTIAPTQLPIVNQKVTIREALTTLTRSNSSKALVVDSENKLIGIIAIIDILKDMD